MYTLKITTPDAITVKNNLLFINCGFSRPYVIPLDKIDFITHIFKDERHQEGGLLTFNINNDFMFVHDYTNNTYLGDLEVIKHEHSFISEALGDYYTNVFRINKPKKISNESFKID